MISQAVAQIIVYETFVVVFYSLWRGIVSILGSNIFPKTKELTRIQIEPQAMDYFARILESSSKTEGGCPNN